MNALLVAKEDGTLRITTTDLNMTMTRVIAAEIKEPGTATVPIARINELVSVFPDQIVALKFDDKKNVLKVSCAGTKSDLKTIPAMDFPNVEPTGKPLFSIDLDASELMSALREVVFAASEEISRPILQGIMFDIATDKIKLAGADGFRLAWRELTLSTKEKPEAKFTILAEGVREIIKMLSGQENVNIKVWTGMNHIKFSVDNAEMLVVALNGDYPDFSPMFDKFKERTTKVAVPIGAFSNACRACAVIAKDTAYITKMSVASPNGNEMGSIVMSAIGSEIGSAESSVDAAVTGETIEVGINLKMVQEILSALSDGELSIELLGNTNPMVFRPVGRDDYWSVIMPMQVPGL